MKLAVIFSQWSGLKTKKNAGYTCATKSMQQQSSDPDGEDYASSGTCKKRSRAPRKVSIFSALS
jgi:hypothetical protein